MRALASIASIAPLASIAAATAVMFATACAGTTPQGGGPRSTPASAEIAPLWVRTTLTYTRLRLFESVNRPGAFTLVRDYRTSTAIEELPSAWNDASQTLTADVSVQLKSENLVFVDDPAVPPGAETPIHAGRSGQLHEVTCPESVRAELACYLLQLLR
jgi:hypothetical protein